MAIAITLNRLLCVGTGLLLIAGGYGCDELSRAHRKDDPASALNAKTSKWRGNSSDGAYSRVDQVSTGKNSFAFTETWYKKVPNLLKRQALAASKHQTTPISTYTASPREWWWYAQKKAPTRYPQ